jgi:hypothetical protein
VVDKSVADTKSDDLPDDIDKLIGFEGQPDPATGYYCVRLFPFFPLFCFIIFAGDLHLCFNLITLSFFNLFFFKCFFRCTMKVGLSTQTI